MLFRSGLQAERHAKQCCTIHVRIIALPTMNHIEPKFLYICSATTSNLRSIVRFGLASNSSRRASSSALSAGEVSTASGNMLKDELTLYQVAVFSAINTATPTSAASNTTPTPSNWLRRDCCVSIILNAVSICSMLWLASCWCNKRGICGSRVA